MWATRQSAWSGYEALITLILAGGAVLLPTYGGAIALISFLILLAIRSRIIPELVLQPRWLSATLLVLELVVLVSLLVNPLERVEFGVYIVAGLATYFAVTNAVATHPDHILTILLPIGLVALVAAIYTLSTQRFVGSFLIISEVDEVINWNVLAGFLAPLLPVPFLMWRYVAGLQRLTWAVLSAIYVIILLAAIVVLGSDGSLLAVLLAVPCACLIWLGHRQLWLAILLGILGTIIGGVAASILLESERLDDRRYIWEESLVIIEDHPTVGVGIGNFEPVFQQFIRENRVAPPIASTLLFPSHAHNLWLHFVAEFGIIAGIASAIVVVVLLLQSVWLAWRFPSATTYALAIACITILIHAQVDLVMWATRPSLLLWVIVGVAVGTSYRQTTANDKPVAAPAPKTNKPAGVLRLSMMQYNFTWIFLGNVTYAFAQWGMLILLARLGSPETVGRYALGLAIVSPVIMFTNFQLRALLATDTEHLFRFGHYLALRLTTIQITLLFITGVVLVSGYATETALVVIGLGTAKAFEALSDLIFGLLQQHNLMERIGQSMILKGPVTIAALGFGFQITGNLVWGVFGLIVAWALMFFVIDLRSGVQVAKLDSSISLNPIWDRRALSQLLLLGFPLGFVIMLVSLNTNIPRYFLDVFTGQRELGIFVSMAYLLVIGNIVTTALGQAASPRLAKLYNSQDRKRFRRLFFSLLFITVLLGVLGVIFALVVGEPFLTLVYGSEYAEANELFVWVMVAAGFSFTGSVMGYTATAMRKIKYQPLALIVVSLVSVLASVFLIPEYKIIGAGYTLVIAAVTTVITYFSLIAFDL